MQHGTSALSLAAEAACSSLLQRRGPRQPCYGSRPRRPLLVLVLALCLVHCIAPGDAGGGIGLQLRRKAGPHDARGRRLLYNAAYQLHGTVRELEYFYATLSFGTPPREFDVIVDTGSTMTYVPCVDCGDSCGAHKNEPYDPVMSTTYNVVQCDSDRCACGTPKCMCENDQCIFHRMYAEQSSTRGVLVEDVLHLAGSSEAGAVPLSFGCTRLETGAIFAQAADGLLGLGNSSASIINQLVQAGAMDDRFSLCFGGQEGDGALLLGAVPLPSWLTLEYTPLVRTAGHYYIVKLLDITIGTARLNIRPGTFDIGYGVVLDSGTTYTHLPTAAYREFVDAVQRHADQHQLQRVKGPDPRFAETDVCWAGAKVVRTGFQEQQQLARLFPSMELHLEGLTLRLSPQHYLFVHGKQEGGYCLGVFDNGSQGTLLGGITFRNVLVEYDRANWRVGFAHAPCKRMGMMYGEECREHPTRRQCALRNFRSQRLTRMRDGSADSEQRDEHRDAMAGSAY